jgi:hypothetical protein
MQRLSTRYSASRMAANGSGLCRSELSALRDQDPFGFEAGDSNLYRYVGNDPTDATDPTGLTECDDRETVNTVRLVNCDRILEAHVNDAIELARGEYNGMPDGDAKGEAIAEEVYNQLGADSGFAGGLFSKIEAWLNDKNTLPTIEQDGENPMIYRYTFKNSLYGDNPVSILAGKVPAHKIQLAADLSIAPTIRVGGVLMGTDKWGHFFQQGYWYWANKLNAGERKQLGLYLEGDVKGFHGCVLPDTPKEAEMRRQAMMDKLKNTGGLPKPGFGSLGAETTGVISYADIAANEEGYKFYLNLGRVLSRLPALQETFIIP